MSEDEPSEPGFSGIDLANSFLPAWAKPEAAAKQNAPLIERYGDRAAYRRAERLKKWLLHHFSVES